ncbi:major facilitator superfamily domain-containing protein [Pseudomassariella vexata]|uniref:Major facilitator superfamily domain-containing protein n=1 Tax=Pseudomassariella vexata TaxID=1141098 RepID=A0A1Y2E151_9PEZI|nr:major facilitator superfamily domain-containing protein [Pseudomassariella vexata]ORY65074.1 major facilitator superfamily domain-containing protein [Pseudomassariella vexata]
MTAEETVVAGGANQESGSYVSSEDDGHTSASFSTPGSGSGSNDSDCGGEGRGRRQQRDQKGEDGEEGWGESIPLVQSHPHGLGIGSAGGVFDDEDENAVDDAYSYELQDLGAAGKWYHDAVADERQYGDHVPVAGSSSRSRRLSQSTVASFQLYTPDEEQAVVRKLDRKLVLFLALCYMVSFLDRSNIGNARIAGMEADLQTRPPRSEWYEWSLTAFYVAYIAFEWMSLLWRIIPAHIFVSMIVLSWGLTASLQSVATSYPVLIFLRTLLGIGEAAFTGVPFYLSFFYKRTELAFRTAIFISAAPLATTFASSLAWLILKVGESGPIAPWRLLFLLEGFPSVIIATLAWTIIPDSPQAARYLTDREKRVAKLRLRHEKPQRRKSSSDQTKSSSGLKTKDVLSVFADPKAWIMAVMFFLSNMAYASLPVFLPTILREMGHTALESQALSVPPYLISFGTVLLTAHLSDRRQYLAVYPAAIGFFNVVVLIIAWSINNQPSESRQGGGFALLQVVGQCGPLVGVRLYPKSAAPYYEKGMTICAGAMLGVAVLAVSLRFVLVWQNWRLDRKEKGMGGNDTEEVMGLVGKKKGERRGFRFML